MARSGDAGGADREPLRGGMREEDDSQRSQRGGGDERAEPPAPYHDLTGAAGEGLATGGTASGSAPREDTPPDPGTHRRSADAKIAQERGEYEREGANAPRDEPGRSGGPGGTATRPADE